MKKNMIAVVNAVKGRTRYVNGREPGVVYANKFGVFVYLYNTIIYAKVRGREYWSDGGWNPRMTSRYIKMLGGVEYSISKKRNNLLIRSQREMRNLYIYGTLKSK